MSSYEKSLRVDVIGSGPFVEDFSKHLILEALYGDQALTHLYGIFVESVGGDHGKESFFACIKDLQQQASENAPPIRLMKTCVDLMGVFFVIFLASSGDEEDWTFDEMYRKDTFRKELIHYMRLLQIPYYAIHKIFGDPLVHLYQLTKGEVIELYLSPYLPK